MLWSWSSKEHRLMLQMLRCFRPLTYWKAENRMQRFMRPFIGNRLESASEFWEHCSLVPALCISSCIMFSLYQGLNNKTGDLQQTRNSRSIAVFNIKDPMFGTCFWCSPATSAGNGLVFSVRHWYWSRLRCHWSGLHKQRAGWSRFPKLRLQSLILAKSFHRVDLTRLLQALTCSEV